MRVAVAGGTGLVGLMVVAALRQEGHEPVVIARSQGVDVLSGQGLAAALDGVTAVVDVTNVTTTSRKKSRAFFDAATSSLLTAGLAAGVEHHVALSIVGIDRVDFGYYEGKRRQEELIAQGSVAWTVLRATQFHEFADQLLARPGPVVVVPRMASQPIAAREVAAALVEIALGSPLGLAPELTGPEPQQMTDMVRQLLKARGSRRLVLPVQVPGSAGKAMASGALRPTGPGPRGTQTFADWLTTA